MIAGGEIAAIFEQGLDLGDLAINLDLAFGQHSLVYAAGQDNVLAVFFAQRQAIHAARGFERVKAVDAALEPDGDETVNVAVAVEDDGVYAVAPQQVNDLAEVLDYVLQDCREKKELLKKIRQN